MASYNINGHGDESSIEKPDLLFDSEMPVTKYEAD
jgi:hypothetical protein